MVLYLTNSSSMAKRAVLPSIFSQSFWNNLDLAILQIKGTCPKKKKKKAFPIQNVFTSDTLLISTSDSKYIHLCSKQLDNKASSGLRRHKNSIVFRAKDLFPFKIIIKAIARWFNNTATGKYKQNWYKNLNFFNSLPTDLVRDEFCAYSWQSEILQRQALEY